MSDSKTKGHVPYIEFSVAVHVMRDMHILALYVCVAWNSKEACLTRVGFCFWQVRRGIMVGTVSSTIMLSETAIALHCKIQTANEARFANLLKFKPCETERQRNQHLGFSALPETAALVVIAAVAVGTAASLLARTTKASETVIVHSRIACTTDCGGSGICAECNGEGFVLKKLSDQSAERARLTAKNMATRYTAGLPKKWSYCSKCSSTRSCSACGGTGKINW
ncbi:hypothetical protein ZIOFF_019330 [Zingiber officinale]|uniref:DUF7895 domain-containing protein n=1 Tax=Zingiber officinale TaxID=94328 RepID=A0A8J5LBK9_ZINOF|nr:hypothetical protein ZIOFF_019330 [Zingiber officinale]